MNKKSRSNTMAKRKSKKNNQTKLILSIILIVLSALTICSLFMPVFTSKMTTVLGSSNSVSNTVGKDVLTACFNGSVSGDFSSGANTLISLKNSDDNGFVTVVFCWSYFIAIVASAGILATSVLSLIKIRINLINLILGVALLLLSVVAFVFGLILAGKFGYTGYLTAYKTSVSWGVFMMIAGLITGCAEIYSTKL